MGVGQGLINSAGFLGDAREFLSGGVQKAADYFAPGSGASAGTFFFKGMPDFVQGAPTSSQLRQQAESVTGSFYQPKTTAGEYARTIGEFAPGALVPGGGLLGNTVRYVVVPALASETAGQFAKGTVAEPWARAAAGLVAAKAGAWWRNLRPGPAAPEIAETLPTRRFAPPEQIADPRPKPSALTDPGPAVSETVPEVGSTASLTVEGGPSRAEQLRVQRAAQLKVNKAAGTAFETTTGAGIDKDVYDYAPQVTVEMPSGAQARLDFMTRNRVTGEIGCLECKSSLTAPMTPNQAEVFSEMEKHTATVVGKVSRVSRAG